MPPKRPLTRNARNAYVEEQFPNEARRRNLDASVLWSKRKKDTRRERIVKSCSKRFPSLSRHEKRRCQYKVEKQWPLWFERCNATVETGHLDPGPERVVAYELDHCHRGLKGDPKRNQWLQKHRRDPADMSADHQQRLNRTKNMILQARAKLQPFCPAVPPIPDNGAATDPLPDQELQDGDKSVLGFSEWVCHKVLYDRSQDSQVVVYIQKDEENITTDRVVVKRAVFPGLVPTGPGYQPPSGEEGEIHAWVHQNCPRHTVQYKTDRLHLDRDTQHLFKRIVMEWVPHGTLADLIDHYDAEGHMIPEPFAWYCFKAVTENALVCWNGQVRRGLQIGWERVVNCDIKPDNVLLAEPDPQEPMEWARRYPVPKVGDFGGAFVTQCGLDDTGHPMVYRRRKNPPDFRGWGTPGFMPPEALPQRSRPLSDHLRYQATRAPAMATRLAADLNGDEESVHSWTMVWEIGMLMWCVLSGNSYGSTNTEQTALVVDFSDAAGSRDQPVREMRGGASMRPAYSGRLVELVYQCLAFLPKDRIDLEDLWEQVVEGCNDIAQLFEGNQAAAPPDGPNGVSFVPDKYPVGQNVLNDAG